MTTIYLVMNEYVEYGDEHETTEFVSAWATQQAALDEIADISREAGFDHNEPEGGYYYLPSEILEYDAYYIQKSELKG